MPSGRTHDRITLRCLPFVIGLTFWLTHSLALTATVGLSFLVGGLMLGPDLDIRSIQYKRWGPIRGIWLPYRMMLTHRSSLSHGPIIGTAFRVIYLALWIALFGMGAIAVLNTVWKAQITWQSLSLVFNYLLKHYLVEWLAILIGLEAGAMSHSISDIIGSHLVHQKRRKKKATRKNRHD
jgi:uncharacterized metal-binding protein